MTVVRDGTLSISPAGSADLNVFNAGTADLGLSITGNAEAGVFMVVREGALPAYTGQTEVTPGTEAVVLATANKTVFSDITINPIPSNYGLITWNGSTLTVS